MGQVTLTLFYAKLTEQSKSAKGDKMQDDQEQISRGCLNIFSLR